MLICNKKGVENGYPLKIEADEVEVVDLEFNHELIEKMMPKMNYPVLLQAAKELKIAQDLPETWNESMLEDENIVKAIHHVLLEVHVKEGKLICPESGRPFPVKNGIPNMLLREDEV